MRSPVDRPQSAQGVASVMQLDYREPKHLTQERGLQVPQREVFAGKLQPAVFYTKASATSPKRLRRLPGEQELP